MNLEDAKWLPGHWERRHGSHCTCKMLADAIGAEPSAADYDYCRRVLQKHWRMVCDHLPQVERPRTTPTLPPHDLHDPLQALLLHNVDRSSE